MVKTIRLIGFWLYLPICVLICLTVSIIVTLFIVGYDIVTGRFKDIGIDVIEYYYDSIDEIKPICKAIYEHLKR